MCEERSRKQFSPLLVSGEARASMFMCGKCVNQPVLSTVLVMWSSCKPVHVAEKM